MAGRWIDNNQDQWRPRDDEPYDYGRGRETRSFGRERPDSYAARRGGVNRDPVFGEGESGASYGGARFAAQDYRGGRGDGANSRERGYRDAPRGYDAPRDYGRKAYDRGGYGEAAFGGYPREPSHRMASGGTGGYDYERGYGEGGRPDTARAERFEDAGQRAGEFLHRAGERVATWFAGGGDSRPGQDDGARGHRGRGPKGYTRSDERISDDIHDRLTDDDWLDASNIVVAVSGGEVTLSGTVDGRDDKHRAERIVEDVAGVTHVQNNLRRTDRSGAFPGASDDALADGTSAAASMGGRKDQA